MPIIERAIETDPFEKSNVSDSMMLIETLRKQVNYSLIRYDIALVYKKYDYVFQRFINLGQVDSGARLLSSRQGTEKRPKEWAWGRKV